MSKTGRLSNCALEDQSKKEDQRQTWGLTGRMGCLKFLSGSYLTSLPSCLSPFWLPQSQDLGSDIQPKCGSLPWQPQHWVSTVELLGEARVFTRCDHHNPWLKPTHLPCSPLISSSPGLAVTEKSHVPKCNPDLLGNESTSLATQSLSQISFFLFPYEPEILRQKIVDSWEHKVKQKLRGSWNQTGLVSESGFAMYNLA